MPRSGVVAITVGMRVGLNVLLAPSRVAAQAEPKPPEKAPPPAEAPGAE